MIKPLLCLLLASAASVCQGQSVWRCGADGRSYSDVPCPEGRVVAAVDPRDSAEAGDIGVAMAREQRLARQYAEQRLERERELRALREGSGGWQRPATAVRTPAAQAPLRPRLKPKRKASSSAGHISRAAVRASRPGQD